jgi:hypothetical protein
VEPSARSTFMYLAALGPHVRLQPLLPACFGFDVALLRSDLPHALHVYLKANASRQCWLILSTCVDKD